MKYFVATLMFSLLATAPAAVLAAEEASMDPRPSGSSVPRYPAEAFFMTTSYVPVNSQGYAFSPDGTRVLVGSDETGVYNVQAFDLATGEMTALTESTTNAIFPVSFFPEDARILYTFDEGGNELNHLYVREVDGKSRDLSPGDNVKALFLGWHDAGTAFWVGTNEVDGRNFDLYRYDAKDYARELVFRNEGGYSLATVSGDGRWLALQKARTSADADIYLQDLSSDSSPALISEHEGNVSHSVLTFTRENDVLHYLTDEFGEFAQAWSYALETGEKSLLLAADWDVRYVTVSQTGRYRVDAINADALTKVTVRDSRSDAAVALRKLPAGNMKNVRFSLDDKLMAFFVDADTQPNNLFVADLATGAARQYTQALNPKIDPKALVEATTVRYPSFDGLEIPAVLYRPHQASAERPVPAVVFVHGGPGGQTRRGYYATFQHLVNHGYAVLGANNRGSSGYGKTFFHLDDKQHGEGDLKDIVWARKYLEGLDWVDGERIGVMGGSYGGYMTAAAMTFHPQAFEVGIDIFGVTNWVRTLESIPPWWESFKEALYDEMGDPAVDGERHRRISPLFHAERIERPMLVVQGANDPRVLKVESDELVEAMRNNDVPVEYVVFDDEGHGFAKRQNKIAASEAYLSFLDRYLSKASAARPSDQD